MTRWIVLVLALALPLRGALGAMQVCPWMEQPGTSQMADMPTAECAGMSQADGHCVLQVACSTTPVLPALLCLLPAAPAPRPQLMADADWLPVALKPPERVPIVID